MPVSVGVSPARRQHAAKRGKHVPLTPRDTPFGMYSVEPAEHARNRENTG